MFFKQKISYDWDKAPSNESGGGADIVLNNKLGHSFAVHLVSEGVVRVVYQLPDRKNFKNSHSIEWDSGSAKQNQTLGNSIATLSSELLQVSIDWSVVPRIQVSKKGENETPFHVDSEQRSYSFDALTGALTHYVERETYKPIIEEEDSPYVKTPRDMQKILSYKSRSEFIYGVGESKGPIVKGGKKFTMEARDAMGYDVDEADILYKINPFYLVFNRTKNLWFGVWYNTLTDSEFDLGAECDEVWGDFRRFTTKANPLDYYIIYADGTLPGVVHQYAKLCTPHDPQCFAMSEALPPLGQFGYLGSTVGLAELENAPKALTNYIEECRQNGFPMDGFHLSSGWCRADSGERLSFMWNTRRYPDPYKFCKIMEKDLKVPLIVNIKPWLLHSHAYFKRADEDRAFVMAPDDEYAHSSANGSAMTPLWSGEEGTRKDGAYFDFSSKAADSTWRRCIHNDLFKYGVTALWIDNNEFSSLLDDDEQFRGEIPLFDTRNGNISDIQKRMGWMGSQRVGSVGRGVQTLGMARSSFYAYRDFYPDKRPFIVSRSSVVGSQAFAHSSWSGDNSTSWKTLKGSTKITLSLGLSVGPGLYGHDIGGFAADFNPSPELLIRWVQQSVFHTRFTVHSNKPVTTSLWMYDAPTTKIIRDAVSLRYRMAPTMYSFYVTHYFKKGWPVLKPLLWYHSIDNTSLVVDEQFIFGDSLLIAPVTDKGKSEIEVFLPSRINNGESISWCDISNGAWYHPRNGGELVNIDAPLDKLPILARSGSIYVLGGACTETIYDGINERTVYIVADPTVKSSGEFTLIEDDGTSNQHTDQSIYTEIHISFEADDSEVRVSIQLVQDKYKLPYSEMEVVLVGANEKRPIKIDGRDTMASSSGVKVQLF